MEKLRRIVTLVFVVAFAVWFGWNSGMVEKVKAETIYHEGDWLYSIIGDDEDDYVTDETKNTVNICGYVGSETQLVIPEELAGMKVTGIEEGSFEGYESCGSITGITIPGGVTYISRSVFTEFPSLKNITVDKSNKCFDSRDNCNAVIETETNTLIRGCSNTKIPESVTSIGEDGFWGCSALTDIQIPESVINIGESAFHWCSSLTSITIPESVTSIGEEAFYGCSALTSISIPERVVSIGGGAFGSCSSLTIIRVDENNKSFDSRGNCNGIIETQTNTLMIGCRSTKIPDDVTSIGEEAFSSCDSLKEIEIPDSVTGIGERAFYGCSALTGIDLPDSVTSIGEEVFYECSALTDIDLPDSLTSIQNSTFWECTALTSVNIPDGVTSIRSCAFKKCSALADINIPESVTSIGEDAFCECSSLKNINIPKGVKVIENYTFSDCKSLTDINISEGVTSIESCAFYECSSLKNIDIPEGVTIIGTGAFKRCALTSIRIPASVTSIGEEVFFGCDLTSIQVDDGNGKYDSRGGCNAIIDTGSNMLVIGCGNTIIPEGVISIGDTAFVGCKTLTSIRIPASVTSIGNAAFADCSLTSIQVDEGNGKYDSREGCNAIIDTESNMLVVGCGNTKIPEGVKNIGAWAFTGCTTLTTITIPGSVKTIGYGAFRGCNVLTDVTISEGVESIDPEAFEFCGSLTNISIPKSVNEISYFAFGGYSDNFVMWVVKDSYAEQYAKGHEYNVKYMTVTDGSNTPPPTSPLPVPSTSTVNKPKENGKNKSHDGDEDKLQKGDSFISGNLKYKITKLKGKKGEVAVAGVKSKKSKSIVIPQKVKKEGITFTVTLIQNNAFKGCSKVKTLTIKATGIKSISGKVLNGLSKRIRVKIPKSKTAQYWSKLRKLGYSKIDW